MKYQLIYIVLILISLGCKEATEADFNNFGFEMQISLPEAAQQAIDTLKAIEVSFTNTRKDYAFTVKTDSLGYLHIPSIEAGFYLLNIAERYTYENYSIALNGSEEIAILEDTQCELDLTYKVMQDGGSGFIIREYYYSASLTPNEKQYSSDQYIEIYNNSPDTLYADSLLIVEHESTATGPSYFGNLKEEAIVVKTIWAFPQDKSYPIAPGQGFIIARDAMNHHSDPNGNPNSPVDLGDAEFEFWSDLSTSTSDIDFPAANMVDLLWVYKGSDYPFHTRGGSAIAIVHIPGNTKEYISNNLITKGTATTSSRFYCQIPNTWVIDAVEAIWNDSRQANKRFANSLDAGTTYIEAGPKLGLCVRRKADYSIGNRLVYQDTNNSTIDFLKDQIPQPRVYE